MNLVWPQILVLFQTCSSITLKGCSLYYFTLWLIAWELIHIMVNHIKRIRFPFLVCFWAVFHAGVSSGVYREYKLFSDSLIQIYSKVHCYQRILMGCHRKAKANWHWNICLIFSKFMLFFADNLELIVVLAIQNKEKQARMKGENTSAGCHLNLQLMAFCQLCFPFAGCCVSVPIFN